MRRSARRDSPTTRRIAHWHEACELPILIVRNTENPEGAGFPEAEQAGDCAADAFRTCGQHGVPHGREDRAAAPVALDERARQQWIPFEVIPMCLAERYILRKLAFPGSSGAACAASIRAPYTAENNSSMHSR